MTQENDHFAEGVGRLRQPVMPLVSMLRLLFMIDPGATVAEVVDGLPEPIETNGVTYERPRSLLREYLDILSGLEAVREGKHSRAVVVDEDDKPADPLTAQFIMLQQEVLTAELERINSLLCGPCGCNLCCVGPEHGMALEFFEIPLAPGELDGFPVPRHDSDASRGRRSGDEDELRLEGRPFYRRAEPVLVHWQSGWSLILPRESSCPNLEPGTNRCRIYAHRPAVCRRPQIFPYLVEPLAEAAARPRGYRIRRSLLAVTDCPYVRELQEEIARYAAACELQLVLKANKY